MTPLRAKRLWDDSKMSTRARNERMVEDIFREQNIPMVHQMITPEMDRAIRQRQEQMLAMEHTHDQMLRGVGIPVDMIERPKTWTAEEVRVRGQTRYLVHYDG